MSHIFGCKQTPPTPPTTSDEESSGSTSDAEMKKKKGNRAMGKKKYPKAIKYYSKAIKIDPNNATYHLNRAIANSALELWKDAEHDATTAVELQDATTTATTTAASSKGHFQLARARLRRGRCLEAREALKLGLNRYPQEPALLQLGKEIDRAVAKLEAKRQQEEEDAAKSAGPSGAKALTDQARALADASPSAALPLLAEAVQAAQRHRQRREEIGARSLQGKVHLRLRQWADAVSSWEAVVQLELQEFSVDILEERSALSNAHNNLGIAQKNAGRLGEASSSFQEAYRLATNGDDKVATHQASQILQNAAQCLLVQGKAAEARALCERSQEICQRLFGDRHGTLALGGLALARCFRAEGDLRNAIASYAKSLDIFSEKTSEESLAELPELPSVDRLQQLLQQTRGELAQLVALAERAKAQAMQGAAAGSAAAEGYSEAAPEAPSQ
ncbi:unnamed protein product [Cladocopium goreaui]|uniref:UDP-N-acetylglucosamine--peptide N-acetylglucosaminyltransferase SPINDLY n=1 Tax=Cladocopium goreaui TaxID=2562237 RepID=A0A9P1FY56_9DINO|nr:unnamed protein product [Cladocopium goreaui]